MLFWVKLLRIKYTVDQGDRDFIQANCTHVKSNYWLFEGAEASIPDSVKYEIMGEEAVECYGDLNSIELRKMVKEIYDV